MSDEPEVTLTVLSPSEAAAWAEVERLRTLLRRLLEWDHFDGAADGPYWRLAIDAALGKPPT